MKMMPPPANTRRPFGRAILTTAILPALLASSAFGVTNWNGPVALSTAAAPDDIVVQGTSTVTLSNGGSSSITESSITFAPLVGSAETLTVDGPGLTLRSIYTILATTSSKTVTINGSADFAPGALYTGATAGAPTVSGVVLIKNGGTGVLILDDPVSALGGTILRDLDGTIAIFGGGAAVNPLSTLTTSIELGSTTAQTTQLPVLRFVGNGVDNTTFANNFKSFYNSTIEHRGTTSDTISSVAGTSGIATGKTLTVNVAEGGLTLAGTIASTSSGAVRGGNLKKTGVDTTLTLANVAFIANLNIAEGRVDVPGRLRASSITFGAGSTLSLRNTSTLTPNEVPTTIDITPGGTLEGLPGNFVNGAVQSTLKLSGGTLNLGIGAVTPGLVAHLYTTGWAAAQTAFAGPVHPANGYGEYTTYFNGIGDGTVTTTGAGGVTELSFDPAFGDTAMFQILAPSYTRTNDIVSRFVGKIIINSAGSYTFATDADDGSMLFVDGAKVVSNNASQAHARRTGTLVLGAGLHDIDIGYYEGGGLNGLVVDYAGPDTGDVQTTIPNSILIPLGAAPTAFLNPITVTQTSTINTASGASVPSLSLDVGKTLNVNGYKFEIGTLALGGAGTYTVNAATQYAEVCARSITSTGGVITLVNPGPGTLVLGSGASPQLQVAGSSITTGTLGVVLGGAGGSPTGNASLNLTGNSLILSSTGGDQSYTPVGLSLAGGGNIGAQQLCNGIAGTSLVPIRATLNATATLNTGATLTLSSRDNYILRVGAVNGTGSINVPNGKVETSGAVNLTGNGQVSVLNASLSTLAGAAARAISVTSGSLTNTGTLSTATNFTVTDSTVTSSGAISITGALVATSSTITASAGLSAGSIAFTDGKLISTGALATGPGGIVLTSGGAAGVATLELRGGSISGGPIAGQGALVEAKSGVTVSTTPAVFTGSSPAGLLARFVTRGTQSGSIWPAQTQGGIFEIQHHVGVERSLTSALSFLPYQAADATISTFFGGVSTEPNQFAIGFFGNFTAPVSGDYSAQVAQIDDDAGFWVDLDNDGVFEIAGANGSELISQRNCCGDGNVGTVTLEAGRIYKVAIAVEDGQGGSSLVGRFGIPGGNLDVIDSSDPNQAGYWSYGVPNQLIVDAGAALDIPSINGSVNVIANGRLDLRGPGSDTVESLTIGDGGVVVLHGAALAPAAEVLPVPEPGSFALLLLGATGFLSRRFRARRS